MLAHCQADYGTAIEWYEHCIASFHGKDRYETANVLLYLAAAEYQHGKLKQSTTHYRESLTLEHELRQMDKIAAGLLGLADVAAAIGHVELAACLLGSAEELGDGVRAYDPVIARIIQPQYERTKTDVQSQLGAEQFASLRAMGKAMNLDHAIAFALQQDDNMEAFRQS